MTEPLSSFAAIPSGKQLERKEKSEMKGTRHNGRSGKNGVYNPLHNDRRFNPEHSEHIDNERVRQNIYWDCYQGYTTMEDKGTFIVKGMTAEEYRNYLEQDFSDVDINEMTDLRMIKADRNKSLQERRDIFLNKVGNPYLVRIGNMRQSAVLWNELPENRKGVDEPG